MARLADVRQWDAARLEGVFRALGTLRDRLVDLDDGLVGCAPPPGWRAPAAVAARADHDAVAERLRRVVTGATACRPVLARTVDEVEALRHELAATEWWASTWGFAIDGDATITDVRSLVLPLDEHAAYRAERTRLMADLRARLDAVVTRADEIDAALADILARAADGRVDDGASTGLTAAARAAVSGVAIPALPADGSPPAAYRDWWSGLSDGQREAALLRYPQVIGNQDGIPAAVRDEANRAQIADVRARLDQDLRAARDRLARPGEYAQDRDRVADLQHRRAALAAVERTVAAPGRQLLVLDMGHPGEHSPHAAVATGDVDTARHVAVFTPGMTTTVAGSLEGYTRDMDGVRGVAEDQLVKADRAGEGVATIAWLGYDAPPDVGSAGSASWAAAGARDLAGFYDGIAAARAGDPPHVTALGHSYGSTTTGYALQQTAVPVDRAVLFGSPGLGTDDVGALHVVDGRVDVLEARGDPVADLGRFGTDPNQLDGATDLSSAPTTLPDGTRLAESAGHSGYLGPGSTGQYNVGVIVAGLDDRRILGENSGMGDPDWGSTWLGE